MRGETMKDKSKKSTYSTTFGIDPTNLMLSNRTIPLEGLFHSVARFYNMML